MKKLFYSTGIIFFLILIAGCEKSKEGSLETMELWNSGSAYYNAKHISGSDYSGVKGKIYADPNNSPNKYTNKYYYYHTSKSPKDLGYTEGPHTDADGRKMWYHPDSYKKPGKNGVWKNGPTTSSGGSSGGSSSGNCTPTYQSPTSDAQLDAYCGYAWMYRCQQGKPLSSPEVQAVCQYYNDLKTASAPPCPYCQ